MFVAYTKDSLEAELIQVAAVAVAWLEDNGYSRAAIFDFIQEERTRQDYKWGKQHHSNEMWSAILGEEYGEACQAVCKEAGF